ncbi:DDRGK domain-containing protein 1 isoform X1 [Tribolium castaneum]|uniref:DDRGK domain-containing protein 1 isoform X1 n=1 Tax=Tribolium castaneum TaxID=7070 RepID=UPI0001757E9C|nr:PREDICTED: DDRGK domain-containing protein 1 isoform X1 [Tribolium castaneum]|eukprot:XP_001814678.1 PREDICTED: DDRGK domain-containing protein 1 isoform X1 [Tribolium castaneum]
MDVTLLVALGSVILLLIISVALFFKKSDKPKADDRPRPGPNRAREGVPRRAQLARNRGARLRANAAPQEQPPSDDELNQNEGQREIEVPDGAKIGAKKKAKLEAKAEKKAQREAEEQSRAERKKKEQLADEERKKAEAKREAEEKRREEEERKAKEEKERREHEEYLKMKEAFSVEEEGFEEGEEGNEMNLLQEFVAYIKNNKVVVIEDLAAHFKLKTQAAIDRIRDLQKDDILTGVIDDRGKFIYVSQEEMEAVAKFIRQRGRVSIVELAESSNKLINLAPVGASAT